MALLSSRSSIWGVQEVSAAASPSETLPHASASASMVFMSNKHQHRFSGTALGSSAEEFTASRLVLSTISRAQRTRHKLKFRLTVKASTVDSVLDAIKWDSNGLVVAIAQHVNTGSILMQGFANRDAIATTITSGRATFYSRSRASLWTKGETSSNFINVVDLYLDCDHDSVIYLGHPEGPTCHTGADTCYFTAASDVHKSIEAADRQCVSTTLYSLEETIAKRKVEVEKSLPGSKPSWTKKLLQNPELLCSKIREEADELCRTLQNNEGRGRTTSEMADVLYHCMVLLAVQDVKFENVLEILRARFSQSGIDEKNSRK